MIINVVINSHWKPMLSFYSKFEDYATRPQHHSETEKKKCQMNKKQKVFRFTMTDQNEMTDPNFPAICSPDQQMTISVTRSCQTTRRHI